MSLLGGMFADDDERGRLYRLVNNKQKGPVLPA